MKKIKLILADTSNSSRASLRGLLELDHSLDIVAEVSNDKELLEKVQTMEADIVLVDDNMSGDDFKLIRYMTLNYYCVGVIIVSLNDHVQNIKKAMLAGAREYLVKPLSPDDLNSTIKKVAELNRQYSKIQKKDDNDGKIHQAQNNKLISIFGTKGGIGKSVICTNTAVAMAKKHKNKIGLIDLDIQFGDISVMMNISPRKTISELMQEGDEAAIDILEDYVYERYGVNILCAPNRPELAELLTPDRVAQILELYKGLYNYTFIDTPSFIDEITLTALEMSDLILLVISLELPTIKNIKKGIEILRSLQLLSRTRLMLNRSSGIAGIEARDVEKALDMKIKAEIPSDGKLVVSSLNKGIPFINIKPRAPISKSIANILRVVED